MKSGCVRISVATTFTLEELVEVADGLLRELAPKQSRYKVTERPDGAHHPVLHHAEASAETGRATKAVVPAIPVSI